MTDSISFKSWLPLTAWRLLAFGIVINQAFLRSAKKKDVAEGLANRSISRQSRGRWDGNQSLRLDLPILERNRTERLYESTQDLVLKELFETEPLRSRFEKASSPRAHAGVNLRTREVALRAWKIALCNSVDGRGLSDHNGIKHQGFMASGSSLIPGGEFVNVSKARGNLVSTKGRQSRGRPLVDTNCDCCKREYESLAHILQVCPRTHESRVARHDSVLDSVEKALKEQKAEVLVEPQIPTPGGIRKPDLVVRKEGVVYVIDCQIVADNADLQKTSKTSVQDIVL